MIFDGKKFYVLFLIFPQHWLFLSQAEIVQIRKEFLISFWNWTSPAWIQFLVFGSREA